MISAGNLKFAEGDKACAAGADKLEGKWLHNNKGLSLCGSQPKKLEYFTLKI